MTAGVTARLGSLTLALAALGLAAAGAGGARAETFELVGQLDPFSGDDRYGDVWGEGDYAYLGSFAGSGVMIIDIADPVSPSLLTVYGAGAGGRFKDVKVHDGIGYFASDNGGGLHIVDLSDPATPALLAQVTSAENGYDSIHNVFYADGYLYEADSRTEKVKVFDVSDPALPFFVRNINTPDAQFIHDITVIGGRLYASGFGGFTYIYDVGDVGAMRPPRLLGEVPTGPNSHSNWVSSDGSLLISAAEISNGAVTIYDISDPTVPVLLSSIDRGSLGIDAFSPHNPVLFSDTLLFVSWYQAGVVAIDISNPAAPLPVGGYDTFPGPVVGFDGNWGVYPLLGLDRVLLSDLDGGLFIIDASPPGAEQIPALPGPGAFLLAVLLASAAATGCRWRKRTGIEPAEDLCSGPPWDLKSQGRTSLPRASAGIAASGRAGRQPEARSRWARKSAGVLWLFRPEVDGIR